MTKLKLFKHFKVSLLSINGYQSNKNVSISDFLLLLMLYLYVIGFKIKVVHCQNL